MLFHRGLPNAKIEYYNTELFFSVVKLIIILRIYSIIYNNPRTSFSKNLLIICTRNVKNFLKGIFLKFHRRHVFMCVHSMRLPLSQPAFVHAILFSTISKTRSLKVGAETPTGSCHILPFWPPPIAFFFPRNTPTYTELISRYPLYLITFATRFITY